MMLSKNISIGLFVLSCLVLLVIYTAGLTQTNSPQGMLNSEYLAKGNFENNPIPNVPRANIQVNNPNNNLQVVFDDFVTHCSGNAQFTLTYKFTPTGVNLDLARISSTNLGNRMLVARNLQNNLQRVQDLVVVPLNGVQTIKGAIYASIKLCDKDGKCVNSIIKKVDAPIC